MKPTAYLCLSSALFAGLVLSGCTGKGTPPPSGKAGKKGMGGDVPVTVAKVSTKDVPVNVQVIGNVEAYSAIAVKAQVGGELMQTHFHEGDYVKKGELLFTIDPRTYNAQLQQAQANLARDHALLTQAEANLARDRAQLKYASAQAGRYQNLQTEGVVSKDQTEQIRSNADAVSQAVNADLAAIESAKAQIKSSEAQIENVKVMLGYTTIRSPINGRTGNVTVKQGNVVTANTVDLMTINEVQPIYVAFSVPEAQLREVKKYMAQGKLSVMAAPQDDPTGTQTGMLTFVDNAVDTTTGTIKLKATFPNNDRKLWPGEFVRVTLRLTTQNDALVVPNQAVQTGQEGAYVFVVKPDRSVESRPVTTGARIDQDMVVESGLSPGETVVTEGQLRLAPGMKVQVRPAGSGPGGRNKRAG